MHHVHSRFFFSSRRRHTRWNCDWSSDVCSSDLAQLALGWFAWKYRDRGAGSQPAHYSHGNSTLEVVWTILTIILFVGMNLASRSIWRSEERRVGKECRSRRSPKH